MLAGYHNQDNQNFLLQINPFPSLPLLLEASRNNKQQPVTSEKAVRYHPPEGGKHGTPFKHREPSSFPIPDFQVDSNFTPASLLASFLPMNYHYSQRSTNLTPLILEPSSLQAHLWSHQPIFNHYRTCVSCIHLFTSLSSILEYNGHESNDLLILLTTVLFMFRIVFGM